MENNKNSCFITEPGFCPDCGSILPLLDEKKAFVTCYACKQEWGSEIFGDMKMTHTIHFNSENAYASTKDANDSDDDADGPIVERPCPQCNNDKMSYATLQLRSADEGQTIFYTCTKCKWEAEIVKVFSALSLLRERIKI